MNLKVISQQMILKSRGSWWCHRWSGYGGRERSKDSLGQLWRRLGGRWEGVAGRETSSKWQKPDKEDGPGRLRVSMWNAVIGPLKRALGIHHQTSNMVIAGDLRKSRVVKFWEWGWLIGMYIKVPVEKRWLRQTVTQGDFNKGTFGKHVGGYREICYGGVIVTMASSEKSKSKLLGQKRGWESELGVWASVEGHTQPTERAPGE